MTRSPAPADLGGSMMDGELLISALLRHAARFHGAARIHSREADGEVETTTWAAIDRRARALAAGLARLGLEFGDRVGTLAWNNRRHLEAWFAISGSGMVCHTLNPRLPAERLAQVAADAGDAALFFDLDFLPLLAEAAPRLSTAPRLIFLGPRDDRVQAAFPEALFFDDLLGAGEGFDWPVFDERTPSALCHTSGTTGAPKGVLYTHRSTLLHTFMSVQPDCQALSARDAVMPVVPMFHVNAWGVPYNAAMVGAELVLPGGRLDGDSLVDLVERFGVTVALGVPTIWQSVLEAAKRRPGALATLDRALVGGAAAPATMFREFRETHGCDLVHGWGMTETSPLATLNRPLRKHGALDAGAMEALRVGQGRPTFGVDLRLTDEAGAPLPHDGTTRGRLQVRGFWIARRYLGADGAATTPDGWFDTGDVATIDADGYMVIRDRAKDVIKSGGEWISSVELEDIAHRHPDVAAAAAVAAPHPRWGERPVLMVQLRDGGAAREADILRLYEGAVARWQIPDRVEFLDRMPLTATGKVRKAELRRRLAETTEADAPRRD
ncbi:MAG: long-chain-fatty-acid--CoA ligase [Pseudomonadota bacterium]|nr:long-chain-fatty-acid--CoA ligase [Pseudomonadota bacterium]MEE3101321.1 long-chain-fatty-acid--CoA ligase [Pseudomonadota bacterium]